MMISEYVEGGLESIPQATGRVFMLRSRRDPQGLGRAIRDRLCQSPYRSLRNIQCACSAEGNVELAGCVENFYLKQLAQESIRTISGVERISNRIRVCGPVLQGATR